MTDVVEILSPLGKLTLRPERDEDRDFRYRLFCDLRQPELALVLPPAAFDQIMRLQFQAQTASYKNDFPAAQFDIIELDHRPLGRIVVDRPGHMIYIVDQAIVPEQRNKGIGTTIMRALMHEAAAAGLPVRLKVASQNDPSMRLYERLGFVSIGATPLYIEMEWRALASEATDVAAAAAPANDAAAETAARKLLEQKRYDEAEEALHTLAARAPNRPLTWFMLGRIRHARGDLDAAIDFLRKAVALEPRLTPAHSDLGIFLQGQGRLDEAEACFRRALALDPRFAEAMSNLGAVLAERGRLEEASGWYRRAIGERGDFADAHNNLGAALSKLDRSSEAEALHRRALALKPDFADAHYNLGVALQEQGRFDEALASYTQAVKLKPEMVDPRWNRALLLLLMGDYAEGWREHEWRWRRKQQPPRRFPQPLWGGEAAAGRAILLHAEQGIGDALQFLRYVPLVAARAGSVIVQVQRPLYRLAAATLGGRAQVIAEGDTLPAFDLHCPLLSLPLAFGTTVETIPAALPYAVDAAAAARWRARIGDGEFKAGLVWAGNPQHKNDRNRSVAIERLRPLFGVPGVTWFSLQVGARAGDLARLPAGTLTDLSDGLTDFAETAAAIANLDVVIAADTAAAHLAGSLGKPVWIMLPYVPDWRWLLGRDDSPWYPSARLFRQPARGDWENVISRVAAVFKTGPKSALL